MSETTVCCGMAKKLGPAKTAELDAELHTPNHRGFKKLASVFATNHMAVKRHKAACLGLGAFEGEQGGEHREQGEQVAKTPPEVVPSPPPSTTLALPPRARAHELDNSTGSQIERVHFIKTQIADGVLVPPRVPTWAQEWGLSERTVRAYVAEAYRHVGVDQGTLDERRILAMARWDHQISMCDDALARVRRRPLSATEESFLLKERASALTGWSKAAGVFEESKVTVNLAVNPVFVSASEAIFAALAAFPEAAVAARKALAERLNMLRQGPVGGLPVITVQGESEGARAA